MQSEVNREFLVIYNNIHVLLFSTSSAELFGHSSHSSRPYSFFSSSPKMFNLFLVSVQQLVQKGQKPLLQDSSTLTRLVEHFESGVCAGGRETRPVGCRWSISLRSSSYGEARLQYSQRSSLRMRQFRDTHFSAF